MAFQLIIETNKNEYNKNVSHPLQSYVWGEFREKTCVKVIRRGVEESGKLVDGFQLTIHKIPHTPWNIGYLPKGNLPSREVLEELKKIGREERCVFIQLEPNIKKHESRSMNQENQAAKKFNTIIHDSKFIIQPSAHPLFTKYTFVLDLTKSEEDILKNMHSKTRYNIRVAQKHGVEVVEDNSDEAFEEYLRLTWETTKRQGFYAHTKDYHRKMWRVLKSHDSIHSTSSGSSRFMIHDSKTLKNQLTAHLLTARYEKKILVAWVLLVFHDTLYYPYGASSNQSREVMASNLMMWEAIRFGKKLGLKKLDMWGSLGPDANPQDPWHGFHRFKQGYGPELVEFIGSYDLIVNPLLYQLYKVTDKLRWLYLRVKK